MEKGGVFVVANIRGGGEFGPKWHQAALKENRQRAYEDFAAVAEDLIKRKVTSPKHLGIEGGENGGLLMGNMITHYPHLFGAVVCQVPLLDMQRYHKLLAGASWMAEYGDPDEPAEWEFIKTFSPYHNVKKDAKYPRDAVHDLDPRRPRPSGPRPQDGGEDEGAGPRRALLREHRGRPRRGSRQQAAGVHGGAGVHILVEAVEVAGVNRGPDGRELSGSRGMYARSPRVSARKHGSGQARERLTEARVTYDALPTLSKSAR